MLALAENKVQTIRQQIVQQANTKKHPIAVKINVVYPHWPSIDITKYLDKSHIEKTRQSNCKIFKICKPFICRQYAASIWEILSVDEQYMKPSV